MTGNDGSTWSVGQEYSPANTWQWTPNAPGSYVIQVWARNAGSSALYDAWLPSGPHTVTVGTPVALRSLVADRTFRVPAGTPITWSATAVGGTAPYTYRFLLYDGSTWSVGQEYSTSNTWTFVPPAAGTYFVQVWARNAGSATTYDAWLSAGPATVTSGTP
jgi:hypothetical protein